MSEQAVKYDAEAAREEWCTRYGLKVGGSCTSPAKRLGGYLALAKTVEWRCRQPIAFDHTFTLIDPRNGAKGVLTMPYNLTDNSADELTRWTRLVGAHWAVMGEGWWFPGTIAIAIWPGGWTP